MDLLSGYACRKCSIQATLLKLEAQRDRLALILPPLPPSDPSPPSSFDIPVQANTPVMTKSRKDRKKKVQALVARVKAVLEAADYEKSLPVEIKVERVEGPAGKTVRLSRVSPRSQPSAPKSTQTGGE